MSFDLAFERVIGHEGGYTNDPEDPGGETQWGISKRSHPDLDIRNLTLAQAKSIYRRDYWVPIGGDALSPALAFQVFDLAVNSGVDTAIRMLERADIDGPDAETILRLLSLRLDHMTRLVAWPTFSRGWSRRIATNLQYAAEDL